ncbi:MULTISPECIES: phosphoserine phosphatase SerB [Microbulbifer]|uniref:phosphoserine phosphatase SerB n=1 Tax=Microbulbifer TaxID=48073 RepID=UPI001CD1BFA4|nr:phosphoserine phosphatase SerB [Microbulbifer agarilyticus]MCA0900349.1 phosphoserine phosphatase SerB [Microbulbifer agarilyticus]
MDASSPSAHPSTQYTSLADASHAAFSLPVAATLPEAPAAVTAAWCLTVLADDIEAVQLQRLAEFIEANEWRPVMLDILAAREDCRVLRIQLEGDIAFAAARLALLELAQTLGLELVLQAGSTQRAPKLACFDMDSTLIQAEVIDELAKIAGVGDQVAEITLSAMRGELDFQQSFRKRMGLLKGFTEASLAEIAPRIPVMPGAQRLLLALRALGCKTAILSGGFTYFANYLQDNHLAVDFVHANQLAFADGALTGEVIDPIVDGARKALLLQEIAQQLDLSLDQVIAVGDGANDLPMLSLGALGIAFHAKPKVRAEAPQAIDGFGLDAALYLFGLNDRQISDLVGEAA